MSKGRVLIVDDEAEVRQSVRLILSKAGYDVIEAEDGDAGVNALKSGDNTIAVDAIICDLEMPKIGWNRSDPKFSFWVSGVPHHCFERIRKAGECQQTISARRPV